MTVPTTDPANRTERRKLHTRNQIIEVAEQLLQTTNSSELNMDQIAVQADVSRKTVYNHFKNKEKLISEIITPMLLFCVDSVKSISQQETIELDDISNLCLTLYEAYGSKLNIIYNINFMNLDEARDLHLEYLRYFKKIFPRVEAFAGLEISHDALAALIFRIFIPMLDTLSRSDHYQHIFTKAFHGMINGLTK